MTREEFVNRWEGEFVAYDDAVFLADLNALLEAERASAREEQRAVDVAAVLAPAREKDPGLERDHPEEVHAARVRRAALAATPLADRIAELERERIEARTEAASMRLVLASVLPWVRRDAFDAQCAWESARALLDRYNNEKKVRAEKAEAALDRARVERDDAERPRDEWRARAEKAERERDEALKLAYVGDHRFSDLTYKARLEELVPKLREAERDRDEAREESKESAASDMDSLQRLRAVEPALERARVERDDAERARDEWKARAEKAEAERDEARAEAARLADLHRRCEAYDDQSGPSCVVLRARAEKAERERDEARSERAETELREVLSVLEGGGPATETLFALAQRGTAKKIRALLGLTLAPEVGS